MELQDFFFDGVLRHQAVHGHGTLLADAVRPVGGLILHRRIPPGVHVDDVVRRRQVEAHAPGPEADEEQGALSRLKGLHFPPAFLGRCAAVEVAVLDALHLQIIPDQGQVADELAENQRLVGIFQQFLHHFPEQGQLGAGQVAFRQNQSGVAAGLPQPHDLRQDFQVLLSRGALVLLQGFHGLSPQGLVERCFFRRHLHLESHLGPGRQLIKNLGFDAPQEKRGNQLLQPLPGFPVAVLLNGDGIALVKLPAGAKQSGIDEVEKGIELTQVIFNGGAGGDQTEIALEGQGGLSPLGLEILDGLGLIEDDGAPLDRCQEFRFLLQQTVTADHHIHALEASDQLLTVPAAEQAGIESRCETVDFSQPVHADGRGGNHQGGPLGGPLQENRQGLKRLSQPHVVRQAGTRPP
ncbi:MAG: hypothetical protein A4E69_00099 [Syntrophus sp. PtaB.Bin138]|nr:MAG: hypothetical protein A4E69_00099 [Syntrophus sp. PtaB.Bin138]